MHDKKIVIACDHAGVELKKILLKHLHELGYIVDDLGVKDDTPVDYPEYSDALTKEIIENRAEVGILICASGIGMSIAANRKKEIRAALVFNESMALSARKHNNANVIVYGSKIIDNSTAINCVELFLTTEFEGGRHERRISKI
jgi:ribose 5-phosphate isomerase B